MVRIVWLQLPVQSFPITAKVVSSNLSHGEVYSTLYYVIKFASDLRQAGGFNRVLQFSPPRYIWNIVKSGAKHHKPNQTNYTLELCHGHLQTRTLNEQCKLLPVIFNFQICLESNIENSYMFLCVNIVNNNRDIYIIIHMNI